MDEMHVADTILKEVQEGKIADIFAEPDKTKIFLQLKELEMIKVTEERVEITEEGKKALDYGIKSYFAHKRASRTLSNPQDPEADNEDRPLIDIPAASFTVPAALILLILLVLLVMTT